MATLEITTADVVIALDMEGRGHARRAAREAALPRRVLQTFVERGGPIPLDEIAGGDPATHRALVALDEEDLIRIRDGHIDLAYPFSAAPTPFTVVLPDGGERYACCAVDALGIAPMIGRRVVVRSRCHQSQVPIEFGTTPDGVGPEAADVMVWVGKRPEERCKVADAL